MNIIDLKRKCINTIKAANFLPFIAKALSVIKISKEEKESTFVTLFAFISRALNKIKLLYGI